MGAANIGLVRDGPYASTGEDHFTFLDGGPSFVPPLSLTRLRRTSLSSGNRCTTTAAFLLDTVSKPRVVVLPGT